MNVQPVLKAAVSVNNAAVGQKREFSEIKPPRGEEKAAIVTEVSGRESREIPEEKVAEVARVLNQVLAILDIEARFSVHEKSREIMVTLLNRDTKEVIRQIPPEKVLDMLAQLKELVGILFDEVI
ncbi:MAG TPA: flagellar protein FlaG [Atribacteraceae bacterium]|nr:flagellar protein FlaG [Atribacteraceae bacterium]